MITNVDQVYCEEDVSTKKRLIISTKNNTNKLNFVEIGINKTILHSISMIYRKRQPFVCHFHHFLRPFHLVRENDIEYSAIYLIISFHHTLL